VSLVVVNTNITIFFLCAKIGHKICPDYCTKLLFFFAYFLKQCSACLFIVVVFSKIATNGLGLGEEGELKAQMLNKSQMLIEVQMLNLALLPLFRQALVSGSCSQFVLSIIHFVRSSI
jgi:hypothetical protein